MIFWYRNSFLASFVSIVGCVIVITGIGAIRSDEISTGAGILIIVVGVAMAILGKVISDKKEEKKQEKARAARNAETVTRTAQNSGTTSYRTQETGSTGSSRNTASSAGNAGGAAGFTAQSAANTAGAGWRSTPGTGSTSGSAGTAAQSAGYASETTERKEIRFCPSCGARLVKGAAFCGSCGTQIKPPSAAKAAGTVRQQEKPKESLEDIFRKAKEYAAKGDYQKELDTLLTGLSIDDGNATLLNNIGRAYRRLGDYHSALDYYYRSAKADPNDLSIGMNIATAYMALGEYEQSEKLFEAEIGKLEASDDPEARDVLKIAYANYAQCAGRKGDLTKAGGLLVKAEKAGYENCETVWNRILKG